MIRGCPEGSDQDMIIKCEGMGNTRFSGLPPILVQYNGVFYNNIYCANCNGIPREKVSVMSQDMMIFDTRESNSINYDIIIRDIRQSTLDRFRAIRFHGCNAGDFKCSQDMFQDECNAYRAPLRVTALDIIAKNEVCLRCITNVTLQASQCGSITNCPTPLGEYTANQWTALFDFTGQNRHPEYKDDSFHIDPHVRCNAPTCQQNRVLSTMSPMQCIRRTSLTFCNTPDSTLILVVRAQKTSSTFSSHEAGQIIPLRKCPKLVHYIRNLTSTINEQYTDAEFDINTKSCFVVSISYFEIMKYVDTLKFAEVIDIRIPGVISKLIKAYVLNFDLNCGIICDTGYVVPTKITREKVKHEFPTFFLENQRVSFDNNHTPLILDVAFLAGQKNTYWALYCGNHEGKSNVTEFEGGGIHVCPKINVEGHFDAIANTLSVSGHTLPFSEFIMTSNTTALICKARCDIIQQSQKQLGPPTLAIFTSVCYSVSMSCLLWTFLVYLRVSALRTIPGLTLMNLIVALFLAQMTYLISSYGLFLSYPVWCQFLGAAQHYLWLTSFAWMACMSFDIFRCLNCLHILAQEPQTRRYYKLVFCCWFTPILLPIFTACVQNFGIWNIGYGGRNVCWMVNPQTVLYLFAIPVFTVVLFNVIMFLASVFSIRHISDNASYAGRKKDGKERLVQCIKISSWMGTSWLFGILPNVFNLPQLWYIFSICNAFQGVHIFLGFGLSSRARDGLCMKPPRTSDVPIETTSSQQNTGISTDIES